MFSDHTVSGALKDKFREMRVFSAVVAKFVMCFSHNVQAGGMKCVKNTNWEVFLLQHPQCCFRQQRVPPEVGNQWYPDIGGVGQGSAEAGRPEAAGRQQQHPARHACVRWCMARADSRSAPVDLALAL